MVFSKYFRIFNNLGLTFDILNVHLMFIEVATKSVGIMFKSFIRPT